MTNAGFVSGNVLAQATSTDYEGSSYDTYTSDAAGYERQYGSSSSETSSGGSASVTNAAGGLIGESATSPVFVSANGDTAASVTNAGRINGSVSANSAGQETAYVNTNAYGSTTDATTGDSEYHSDSLNSYASTNLGGDASFSNAAGGLVTGSVDVRGQGSATVDNEGAVIGTTYAESTAQDTTSTNVNSYQSVFTAGADGGTVVTQTSQQTYSSADSGGDVTGTYAGTNGAVQFAPFGGASDGSVTQIADGNSSALVSGTIFGDFTGYGAGYEYASVDTDNSQTVYDADGDIRSYELLIGEQLERAFARQRQQPRRRWRHDHRQRRPLRHRFGFGPARQRCVYRRHAFTPRRKATAATTKARRAATRLPTMKTAIS